MLIGVIERRTDSSVGIANNYGLTGLRLLTIWAAIIKDKAGGSARSNGYLGASSDRLRLIDRLQVQSLNLRFIKYLSL